MKAIVADAWNVSSDRVICAKGSYYLAEIDGDGNIRIRDEMRKGISLEG